MEKRIKGIFREEEDKINKITKEINEAENQEKKSQLAEMLLIVVDNALDKLDKSFKVHKEYDYYKKTLLARKEIAVSIIKMKGKNPLGAINALFNIFKKLLGR